MNYTAKRIGILVVFVVVYALVTWSFPSTQVFLGGFFAGWVFQSWSKDIADAWTT